MGSNDQLTVTALRGDGPQRWGPLRGRGYTINLLKWLEGLRTRGGFDFNVALRDFAMRTTRAGVCIVISDLMAHEGYQDGLRALQGRGHEVTVIHTLSPDEVNPEITGDLKLVDIETGIPQEVTIDEAMKELYTQRLQAWQAEINTYCARRGMHYVAVDTGTPWEQLILSELRQARVVH
ncbi:MAG: hypothetical protein K8S97_15570, partial [Anaerolineae bacterium]|nr:hypothetical protein [Anaerolineae bacterium]